MEATNQGGDVPEMSLGSLVRRTRMAKVLVVVLRRGPIMDRWMSLRF